MALIVKLDPLQFPAKILRQGFTTRSLNFETDAIEVKIFDRAYIDYAREQ